MRETYGPGYTWEALKKELQDNYSEASVMSNQELVKLFMGGLSSAMGQGVLQYLGSSTMQTVSDKGKERDSDEVGRPEDRYNLAQVCQAAGEVSENAQRMLLYKWGSSSSHGPKRGSTEDITLPHLFCADS